MLPPSVSFSSESEHSEEISLHGASLSEGIAIGVIYFPEETEGTEMPRFAITADQVDREIERYRTALDMSKADLEHLQCSLAREGLQEAVGIISAHLEMLKDPLLTTEMEGKLRKDLYNIESVFRATMQEFASQFSKNADLFFQQRLVDVMDVSKRILGHLRRKPKRGFYDAPNNSVVIAKEIDASETASAGARRVSAFITATGGAGSHSALIARSRGIPYVASVDVSALRKAGGQWVIVDGTAGKVILNPKRETIVEYRKKQRHSIEFRENVDLLSDRPAETFDGHRITLLANIGALEEIDFIAEVGAEGIGLLRTELLFIDPAYDLFSEEIQYAIFAEAIRKANGKPIVIRLFDFGGDKRAPGEKKSPQEANPLLGCRGVRYLLKKHNFFKTHLRALLRAGLEGDVRLLVPLVSDVSEMKQVREMIQEVVKELKEEKIPYRDNLPVGCMLEVPSALLLVDALAPISDFFSLGTNDLTQYVLGVDRINPHLETFYQPIHPSVLRLMRFAILEVKKHKRPLSVCGDIASQPLFVPLLIGLGVDELSVMPRNLPDVKKMLRGCSVTEAYRIAREALERDEAASVYELLLSTYSSRN